MDKRLAYLLIAVIVLITFGTTIFIYWQQSTPQSDSQQQTPEVYFAGGTNAELSIQNQNLTSNQRATVPIYIKTDTQVATIQIVLEYDAALLDIEDTLTDESNQFDTPFTFNIDDTKPINARRATIVANTTQNGVNTNGTQQLLANLRITPHLPSQQQSATTQLKFIYSANDTNTSHAITLTGLNNVLAQPSNPTFTITGNNSANATILSIEEKELVMDESTTIDLTLTTPQQIKSVQTVLEYDPSYLDVSTTYIESDDFDNYPLVEINKTNGTITVQASSDTNITGDLKIITFNITPLATTTTTNINFDFTPNSTTGSHVTANGTTNLLTSVNNATYEIVEEATSYACYTPCDSDSQCPGNECALANGEYICINLDCTDTNTCSCPESEYLSQKTTGGISSLTAGTYFSASASATPTPSPKATPKPTASSSAQAVIDDLPQAGSVDMTLAILALGISALLLGLLTRKDIIK